MPHQMGELAQKIFGRFDLLNWLGVAAVLVVAFIMLKAGNAAIERFFYPREGSHTAGKRAQTLAALLKSVLRYAVYFIAGLIILGLFGVQTSTLLAGAGVVGLAVGFGAKNLIQDVIAGFFILFEDQFAVGDYVSISGVTGIVEEVGLRVTRLKDTGGQLHYIPNGRIAQVTNYSRGSLQVLVDVIVAGDENLDRVIAVLEEAGAGLARDWPDIITAGPDVLGVVALGPGEVTIRLSASAKPLQHWKVERELRKRAKIALDAAGVRMPGAVQQAAQ
ncbi:MAG: mechanosensitive ion channel family protein [Pelotomaculum sp.]|uniref:Small-conductance mechanosensitive channel n=1 Tax=Pelotomaculum thermopropionicum (strain DSM 13744 / JCM 10971 / SI) TaxID=370438 RepID=A5CY32_PELTS|nr:mechanosensitive ion channel family protein [Pelotomaculum sp.]BAF61084.1 small-conductance mechanosensitive channel [Pelotomaculum thermopropionicum SI]